jgi:hypothetical protein
MGITLITIPFWWNKSVTSLAATIKYYRPDIPFENISGLPMSANMPIKLQNQFKYTPNAFKIYDESICDPTGWYVMLITILIDQVADGKV